MDLKEARKILGYQLNMKDTDVYMTINYEAISTVLQEIDRLQKENEELIKETRKKIIIAPCRRGLTKTYEYGLVVGTKREREYWKNKIREKIEEIAGKQGYVFATEVLGDLLKEE